MLDVRACRSCLTTKGTLRKISEVSQAYVKIYETISGLKISEKDGFPARFCTLCCWQMKKTLMFKRRCLRAYYILKEILVVNKTNQVAFNNITEVDLKKTNLLPTCDFWKSDNCGFYSMSEGGELTVLNDIGPYEPIAKEVKKVKKKKVKKKDEEHNTPNDNANLTNPKVEVVSNQRLLVIEPLILSRSNEETKNNSNDETKNDSTEDTKQDSKEYKKKNPVFIVTDIKPDKCDDEEKIVEAANGIKEEQAESDNEILTHDDEQDEVSHDEPIHDEVAGIMDVDPTEIDMEDVFKDLKEDVEEDEGEWPETSTNSLAVEGSKEEETVFVNNEKIAAVKIGPKTKIEARTLRLLDNCTIETLTPEQQAQAWKERQQLEPYKSAARKCHMCIQVFKYEGWWSKHMAIHRYQHTKNKLKCSICRDKYADILAFKKHHFERHRYKITCNICQEVLYTWQAVVAHCSAHEPPLEEHMAIARLRPEEVTPLKRGENKYPCNECPFKSRSKIQQRMHETFHEKLKGRKHYTCDVCHRIFISSAKFESHMDEHHVYSYTCNICKKTYNSRSSARDHLDRCLRGKADQEKGELKSEEENELKCPECGKQFRRSAHFLTQHMALAHGLLALSCPDCGRALAPRRLLLRHQLRSHGYINVPGPLAGLQQFACNECPVGSTRFENARALDRHRLLAKHESAKDMSMACFECCEVFVTAVEEDRHQCRSHAYPRTCKTCGYVAANYTKYFSHRQKEHSNQECPVSSPRRSICEACGFACDRKYLRAHQMAKHGISDSEVKINCRFCTFVSPSVGAYAWHVLSRHTPRPYHCALCGAKPFPDRCQVREHVLRAHAPVLPYQCSFCAERFAKLALYAAHAAAAHGADVKAELTRKHHKDALKMRGKLHTYPHVKLNIGLLETEYHDQVTFNITDYLDVESKPADAEQKRDYLLTKSVYAPINVDPFKAKGFDWSDLVEPTDDDSKIGKIKEVKEAQNKRKRNNRVLEKVVAVENDNGSEASKAKKRKKEDGLRQTGVKAVGRNRHVIDLNAKPATNAVLKIVHKSKENDDRNFVIQGLEDVKYEMFSHLKDEEDGVKDGEEYVKDEDGHVKYEDDYFEDDEVATEEVVEEEVVDSGSEMQLVSEDGKPLDIIDDDGIKYVLVDGDLYKLEFE